MSASADEPVDVAPADPTGSAAHRERFARRFQARWRSLRGEVRSLVRGDRHYRPASDRAPASVQVADFREWLDATLADVVVEPVAHRAQRRGGHWTARFVRELYDHGLEQADAALDAAGYDVDGALPAPAAALRRDAHRDTLASLYVETHQDVVDASNAAERDATRAYRDAVRSGAGIRPTVSAVNGRLDAVGDTRTDLVARSKSVIVVNEAMLARFERAGVESVGVLPESVTEAEAAAHGHHAHDAFQEPPPSPPDPGDGVVGEWVTAGDRRVCPECASLAGSTYPIAEIRVGNAPMPVRDTHPECRCAVIPVPVR